MTVQGAFVGKKKKHAAVDLSGLSCLPPVDGRTACIAVNDENAAAQLVAIDGDKLVPGPTVPLIGSAPDPGTLGTAPVVKCGAGNGEYGEFDGEAVSFTKPYFYVIGSHGCSRKSDEFRVSSFVLARVKVDDAGRPLAGAETTYRVSDVLGKEAEVGLSFGKKLEGASGLNVEGMIAEGNRIWLGLRAPLDAQGRAVLLEASASELFKVDH